VISATVRRAGLVAAARSGNLRQPGWAATYEGLSATDDAKRQ
jgi:hypothetical protein